LADTLFVSSYIEDLGILNKPTRKAISRSDKEAAALLKAERQTAAQKITYGDYLRQGAWPFWTKKRRVNWSLEEFVMRSDLSALSDLLATDQAFRLMHNQDDFLVRSKDLERYSKLMKGRSVIYPYGGHVGNIWKNQNLEDLSFMLNDLK
jgi:hypothetical protein